MQIFFSKNCPKCSFIFWIKSCSIGANTRLYFTIMEVNFFLWVMFSHNGRLTQNLLIIWLKIIHLIIWIPSEKNKCQHNCKLPFFHPRSKVLFSTFLFEYKRNWNSESDKLHVKNIFIKLSSFFITDSYKNKRKCFSKNLIKYCENSKSTDPLNFSNLIFTQSLPRLLEGKEEWITVHF